jgi:hypothetical protein
MIEQQSFQMPRTVKTAPRANRVMTATRLSPQMRQTLVEAAENSGRSLCAEIELRLELADHVIRRNIAA